MILANAFSRDRNVVKQQKVGAEWGTGHPWGVKAQGYGAQEGKDSISALKKLTLWLEICSRLARGCLAQCHSVPPTHVPGKIDKGCVLLRFCYSHFPKRIYSSTNIYCIFVPSCIVPSGTHSSPPPSSPPLSLLQLRL